MKISLLNTYHPVFKSHSYKVRPFPTIHLKVLVPDSDKGDNPVFVNKINEEAETFPMERVDNNWVFSSPGYAPLNYYVKYDTGDVDLNQSEKLYHVDTPHLIRKAGIIARAQHKQSAVLPIKEGEAVGKIIFFDWYVQGKYQKEVNEPSIIICRNWDAGVDNTNIVGIIITYDGNDACSHNPIALNSGVDVSAIVLDEDLIDKLRNLDGKRVKIVCKGEKVEINEVDANLKRKNRRTVDVPILKYCDKILTSKEYSPEIIGTKAVNLRRLEELKEQGKINATIPKSIALPWGYIEEDLDPHYKVGDRNTLKLKKAFKESGKLDEILKAMEENGINTEKIMIRSAFNCEDLPNYSAAGAYASYCTSNNKNAIVSRLQDVVLSKYFNDGCHTRKLYNIPDDIVKPGAIIQNRVNPDYKFTIYTDDGNGNVRVNLYSGIRAIHSDVFHPHVFRYKKETGKLTYDSIQMTDTEVTFDENENMIDITPLEEDLSDNKDLFEQLEKAIKDALVVEKEFGAPQDIEGGIKNGKIYFWQSRNIVK